MDDRQTVYYLALHTTSNSSLAEAFSWTLAGWVGGWMEGWMDGRVGRWLDGWMDGWNDGWIDGWMDGWMDGRVGLFAADVFVCICCCYPMVPTCALPRNHTLTSTEQMWEWPLPQKFLLCCIFRLCRCQSSPRSCGFDRGCILFNHLFPHNQLVWKWRP